MNRVASLLCVLALAVLPVLAVARGADCPRPQAMTARARSVPVRHDLPPGLRSRDAGERAAAVRALAAIEGEAAHAALLAALRDAVPVRRAALEALALRAGRDPRARAALEHAAAVDPAAPLRELACAALDVERRLPE
jgi:hypothetical protein